MTANSLLSRLAKLEIAQPILGRFIVVGGVISLDAAISVLAERNIKFTADNFVINEPGPGAPTVDIIDVTQTHDDWIEEKRGQHGNAA